MEKGKDTFHSMWLRWRLWYGETAVANLPIDLWQGARSAGGLPVSVHFMEDSETKQRFVLVPNCALSK